MIFCSDQDGVDVRRLSVLVAARVVVVVVLDDSMLHLPNILQIFSSVQMIARDV